jgi:VanZ family protein
MKQFLRSYLTSKWPAILWSAIVFVFLAMPGNGLFTETWFNKIYLDKLVHAFLFFVLTWLWVKYVTQSKNLAGGVLVYIAVAATFYGITMEFVQIYVGRDFSIGDMIADGAGAFLGIYISRHKK